MEAGDGPMMSGTDVVDARSPGGHGTPTSHALPVGRGARFVVTARRLLAGPALDAVIGRLYS